MCFDRNASSFLSKAAASLCIGLLMTSVSVAEVHKIEIEDLDKKTPTQTEPAQTVLPPRDMTRVLEDLELKMNAPFDPHGAIGNEGFPWVEEDIRITERKLILFTYYLTEDWRLVVPPTPIPPGAILVYVYTGKNEKLLGIKFFNKLEDYCKATGVEMRHDLLDKVYRKLLDDAHDGDPFFFVGKKFPPPVIAQEKVRNQGDISYTYRVMTTKPVITAEHLICQSESVIIAFTGPVR